MMNSASFLCLNWQEEFARRDRPQGEQAGERSDGHRKKYRQVVFNIYKVLFLPFLGTIGNIQIINSIFTHNQINEVFRFFIALGITVCVAIVVSKRWVQFLRLAPLVGTQIRFLGKLVQWNELAAANLN